MEPLDHVMNNLRNRWPLVVLTAGAAVVTVLALNLIATPRYRTTARFLITPVALEDPADVVDSTDALDNSTLAADYAEVFNSPSLQRVAATGMGLEVFEDYEFSSVVLPDTSILQLSVTGPDAMLVARLANVLGEEVIAYMRPFATVYQLRSLDPAVVPESPYSPRLLLDLGVAFVVGTITGLALAIGLSYLPTLASLPNRQPVKNRHTTERDERRDAVPMGPVVAEGNVHDVAGRTDKS